MTERQVRRVKRPRRITRRILKLRIAPFGTVLDLRTTSSKNCEAVPRRARIEESQTFVSFNSRLKSNKERERGEAASLY